MTDAIDTLLNKPETWGLETLLGVDFKTSDPAMKSEVRKCVIAHLDEVAKFAKQYNSAWLNVVLVDGHGPWHEMPDRVGYGRYKVSLGVFWNGTVVEYNDDGQILRGSIVSIDPKSDTIVINNAGSGKPRQYVTIAARQVHRIVELVNMYSARYKRENRP